VDRWIGITAAKKIQTVRRALPLALSPTGLRASRWPALSEVELVAGDPEVVAVAKTALEVSRRVHYAEDGDDLTFKSNAAEDAVRRFIALAAAEIQSIPSTVQSRTLPKQDRSQF